MGKHTLEELHQWQALPLEVKVLMTKERIRNWVKEYGIDGVCVSFSGGKDSTVLLHIAREEYPEITAVFVDTGLEFPETRDLVRNYENVTWLKPKLSFRQVIDKYGYPFFSKEAAECIYKSKNGIMKQDSEHKPSEALDILAKKYKQDGKLLPERWQMLMGDFMMPDGRAKSFMNKANYKFALDCPYSICHYCCDVMKKKPIKEFQKATGKFSITGQMACESKMRTRVWLQYGCNGFEMKTPISNPMAFWTEQDVLTYIKEHDIPIAEVYGEIVTDYSSSGCMDGQMSLADLGDEWQTTPYRPQLKTTGAKRTGCMFCGFGCHLEKPGEGRFEKMKVTHPKQYAYIMKDWEEGGLGYKRLIDWINENGNMKIRY